MIRNLALLAVACVLVLAGLEFATRLIFDDIGTTGDNGSWFARRWHAEHPPLRNALGFRERDFAPTAPPEVYRIAVVGDSFIYGQGILESERMTDRLEQRLNAAGTHFEVLNFGDSGANYERNTSNTELAITAARPDFVLLSWYQNDVVDPDGPKLHQHALGWKLHRWLNPHSALYSVANEAFARLQSATGIANYAAGLAEYGGAGPWAERAQDRLRALLEVPRRHGVPAAMILWRQPAEATVALAEEVGLIDRVLAVCAERNIACLDLGPALAPHAAGDRLILNRFDTHPNGRANELAAEAVLAAFAPLWQEGAARKRQQTVEPKLVQPR